MTMDSFNFRGLHYQATAQIVLMSRASLVLNVTLKTNDVIDPSLSLIVSTCHQQTVQSNH